MKIFFLISRTAIFLFFIFINFPIFGDCLDTLAKFRGGLSTNREHQNRLTNSINEIYYILPFLKDRVTGYVVKNSDLLAETDGKYCIIISDSFMDKIFTHPQNKNYSDSMLTFILGHEIGHSILKHNQSCLTGYKSSTHGIEMTADAFGGFLIFALDESLDAPGKVFSLIKENSKKDQWDCHGDPDKRDALLLQKIGTIKYNARVFKEAMDMVVIGTSEEIKQGIKKIESISNELSPMGVDKLGIFDFAIASAYHRLWMIEGNEPEKLLLQSFIYFPESIVSGKTRGKQTGIPGNLSTYKTTRKLYEAYLQKHPSDLYAKMNLALLYMYDKSNEHKYLSSIKFLRTEKSNDPAYLNNMGVLLLYDAMRKNNKNVSLAEKYFTMSMESLSETDSRKMEAGILFNLYKLYSFIGNEEQSDKFAYEFSKHPGSTKEWKALLKVNIHQSEEYKSVLFLKKVGDFTLGMSVKEAEGILSSLKMQSDSKEFNEYQLVMAKKGDSVLCKFWFQKNKLIKLVLYEDSNIEVKGIKCGSFRKHIPTDLGVPLVRGNRLFYPGTNISFKTKIVNNNEVISQIEIKMIDEIF
jgi:hypothetical protein